MNVMSQNTLTIIHLAEAHLLAGRVDEATHHAARALTLSRERNERGYEAWARRLTGEIASRGESPDLGAAASPYREALWLAEELGMRPLAAHCHTGLGRLGRRAGDGAMAREHLTRAATMYTEMDMKPWRERVEAEIAQED